MGFMMNPTDERPIAPASKLPWGERRGRAEEADILLGVDVVDEGVEVDEGSNGGSGTVDGERAASDVEEEDAMERSGAAGGIAKYGTPVRYVRIVDNE